MPANSKPTLHKNDRAYVPTLFFLLAMVVEQVHIVVRIVKRISVGKDL